MSSTQATFFWFILSIAFVVMILSSFFMRASRKRPALRTIAGYHVMPKVVAGTIESAQPMHFSIGSAAVGQTSTLNALIALSIVHDLTQRQGFTQLLPEISLSDPISLAIAQDTLRRAYLINQNKRVYRSTGVNWYPNSLALAAGSAIHSADVKAGSNIYLADYGSELAFIGEVSARYNQFFIGHSTQLAGQAVAYAQADAPLIGEELFVGAAYLSPEKSFDVGGVVALDVLRWVAIAAIILIAISR
jgi:hypothetical protein